MMIKLYNVGDKVKIIAWPTGTNEIKLGKEGIITDINSNKFFIYQVKFNHENNWSYNKSN